MPFLDRLGEFVKKNLFGADFDPFLVRAAQMNAVMASNAEARLFNINALEFPAGHLPGLAEAKKAAKLGTMDLVMTNPPFGSDIPITDTNILKHFELARIWERTNDGGFRNTGRLQGSVAPEVPGSAPSISARYRRMSTMSSTISMNAGHTSTHAMHVVHPHSASGSTIPGTPISGNAPDPPCWPDPPAGPLWGASGRSACARTPSDSPTMMDFGFSGEPLM